MPTWEETVRHFLFCSLVWVSASCFFRAEDDPDALPGEQELLLAPSLVLFEHSTGWVWTPMSQRPMSPRRFSPSSLRAMAAWMWRADGRGAKGGREVARRFRGEVVCVGWVGWRGLKEAGRGWPFLLWQGNSKHIEACIMLLWGRASTWVGTNKARHILMYDLGHRTCLIVRIRYHTDTWQQLY